MCSHRSLYGSSRITFVSFSCHLVQYTCPHNTVAHSPDVIVGWSTRVFWQCKRTLASFLITTAYWFRLWQACSRTILRQKESWLPSRSTVLPVHELRFNTSSTISSYLCKGENYEFIGILAFRHNCSVRHVEKQNLTHAPSRNSLVIHQVWNTRTLSTIKVVSSIMPVAHILRPTPIKTIWANSWNATYSVQFVHCSFFHSFLYDVTLTWRVRDRESRWRSPA